MKVFNAPFCMLSGPLLHVSVWIFVAGSSYFDRVSCPQDGTSQVMTNPEKLFEVFTALRGRIASVVLRIAPPQEVEDIVQETYVRVCQAKNKETIREPRSFLFRTAQNLALDYVKKAESRLTSTTDLLDESAFSIESLHPDATFEQVASSEKFAQFCEAVRRLPQQCRRAFVLKKVYGRTQKEIAEDMGISESAVENHIARGMKRVQATITDMRRSVPGHRADAPVTSSVETARRGGKP